MCSTDHPVDDLEPHQRHATNPRAWTRLFPTWRPDKALGVHDLAAWNIWVDKLEAASSVSIGSLDSFIEALGTRHDFFHETGCRASDHGLDRIFAAEYTASEAQAIFAKARARRPLSEEEIDKLRSSLLYDLAVMDHARGWVQQFHLGAMRNNSSRAVRMLGPDTGYDAIGDLPQGATLVRFYNLNPADNEVLASIIGSFQDGSSPGKMQLGGAWWFLDQLDGMEKQMNALSNLGLLARFVAVVSRESRG